MTMKGQTRDLNTLRVQYLENSSWRMLFSNNQLLDLRWGSAVGYLLDSLASFLLLTVCYWWVVYTVDWHRCLWDNHKWLRSANSSNSLKLINHVCI